jgi:CRP/FNR family transcriptional activator FtrB
MFLPNRALTPAQCDAIGAYPLFAPLPPDLRRLLLAEAAWGCVEADSTLFRAGERPRHLLVVMDGEIGLTGSDESGEQTLVEILRPGAAFVEAAVMTDQPYLMGARTLRASTLLALPAEQVRRDVARSPELAAAMVASLSLHFRAMVAEIKDLKLKTANQRLALYLLELAGPATGSTQVHLPHPKGVVAARIGIRRETLSRSFNTLRSVGVIAKGPSIAIADVATLRRFATNPGTL